MLEPVVLLPSACGRFIANSSSDLRRAHTTNTDSGNVAADGNFSIQVLSEALKTFALECVPLACEAAVGARAAPEAECAFLCNLREHWFTIRSASGDWYNFNSLYTAPEALSPFYLGAYLSSLQAEGARFVRLLIHLRDSPAAVDVGVVVEVELR